MKISWMPIQKLWRRVGYLPERPPLYPEMRVLEYLFRVQIQGGDSSRKHLEGCLEQVGLSGMERRLVGVSRRAISSELDWPKP